VAGRRSTDGVRSPKIGLIRAAFSVLFQLSGPDEPFADFRGMRSIAQRSLVAALLAFASTEWNTSPRSASGLYPPDRLPRAKVTFVDGKSVELLDARVRPDSVVGTEPASLARLAFPIEQVSRIESQEFSQARTVSLFAAMGLAFVGVTLYIVAHTK
jgi:hypothetical protein